MDIALKKLDLVQRLLAIWDEAALQRVANAIEQEVPEMEVEDGFTGAEVAELEEEHGRALRGEGTSYTWEEVKRKAREALKQ